MALRHAKKLVVTQERGDVPMVGPIRHPSEVAATLDEVIGPRAYEVLVALYLDNKNKIFAYDEFTEGSLNSVSVSPSGLLRNALLAGALGVITVHQHPSGDATPSQADTDLWAMVDRNLKAIGLVAVDHLVVARRADGMVEYWSAREGRKGTVIPQETP